MKRLLIATDSFLPRWDGIARFLYEIVPRLKNFEVTILAPDFPGEGPIIKGAQVFRVPVSNRKWGDIQFSKFKTRKVKTLVKKADIVFTQSIGPIGGLAMIYAKKMKKPLYSYVHSVEWDLFSESLKRGKMFVRETTRKLVRYLYNKCDKVLVPFDGMKKILDEANVTAQQITLHLGADVERFVPVDKKKAKEHLNIPPEKVVIGYVGRFGREKNLDTLYSAFEKLRTEHNLLLLLVGGKIQFENMEDIRIIPSSDEVEKYYQAMDIYVLPSVTETTSLTTMEAMSSGVAPIVTTVGYIPEYVKHKKNGLLFPPRNVERLTILLEMLISDERLRARISKNARETMTQKFNWDDTARRIEKILGS